MHRPSLSGQMVVPVLKTADGKVLPRNFLSGEDIEKGMKRFRLCLIGRSATEMIQGGFEKTRRPGGSSRYGN